jgi:hypothetical protein
MDRGCIAHPIAAISAAALMAHIACFFILAMAGLYHERYILRELSMRFWPEVLK